jgi:hypothetical protein
MSLADEERDHVPVVALFVANIQWLDSSVQVRVEEASGFIMANSFHCVIMDMDGLLEDNVPGPSLESTWN